MVLKTKTIACFGAHPDDVELGMAGTVGKLSKLNYDVHLIIATIPSPTEEIKRLRRQEAIEAAKIMGCKKLQFLDLNPETFRFGRELVSLLEEYLKDIDPEAIFCPWVGDSHQDHQFLARALFCSSRHFHDLYMYETMIPGGITEKSFRPQLYVDISETIDIKRRAVLSHKTQLDKFTKTWIDAVIARCSYRGFQMKNHYAESFEVIRTRKW